MTNFYKTLEDVEHVLEKPGMYVGEIDRITAYRWIINHKINKFIRKEVSYVPGLEKLFDEVLVNARDQYVDYPNQVTEIKVNINQEKNIITINNNGPGFNIYYDDTLKIWSVEQALTKLRTSGRFDQKNKITGGTHGFGAKLTVIFSKQFKIETIDPKTKRKYTQIYSNNRKKIHKPKIIEDYDGRSYTKITFIPDFEKFEDINGIDLEMYALLEKRVYDIAGVTPKTVKVYFNNKRIPINNFTDYAKMYINSEAGIVCEDFNDRWTVCIAENDHDIFMHVSFVNGINTYQGGTHVDYLTNQLVRKVRNILSNRKDKEKFNNITPAMIKKNIFLFVNCKIEGAGFNSQTKEMLQTQFKKFGSTCNLTDEFLKKVINKTDLITKVNRYISVKQDLALQKATKGTKKVRIIIPKLEDANWAGTNKSNQCILMLVEGDSAKTFVVNGFSVIGRDKYGVFPLKGKLLNVREASAKKLQNNKEIINIAKILGLEIGKNYKDTSNLRYGHIMIVTDADVDGLHIKGLIINFIDNFWPELGKKANNFIKVFVTPIIKGSKGNEIKEFLSVNDYNSWKGNLSKKELNKWKIKYYKGLGTWTPKETKNLFKKIEELTQTVSHNDKKDTNAIQHAFDKKFSDSRKDLVRKYDPNFVVDYSQKYITYCDYVKNEWVHFAVDDNARSIPSIIDGLKPSQRKIIHVVLNKNIINEIKVSQLGGKVAELTEYKHGESSLYETIIKLANDYVGSNNIELLVPEGDFGTRVEGGKNAASPRYIFTYLSEITPIIFNKMDLPLLNYINEDGSTIEPIWFIPIIPLILCNGGHGIGTGYSTDIPNYNPIDIVNNLKRVICNKEMIEMVPWYRDFHGSIHKLDNNDFLIKGKYKILKDRVIQITELPIGTWTGPYKEFIDKLIEEKYLVSVKDECTNERIKLTLLFNKDVWEKFTEKYKEDLETNNIIDVFEDKLKLIGNKRFSKVSNMHLFNSNNILTKYSSPLEIIKEYSIIRLKYYSLRKEYWIKLWREELKILNYKIKFLRMYLADPPKIILARRPIIEIINDLKKLDFPEINNNYNYLLDIKLKSITKEKLDKLMDKYHNKKKEYDELHNKSPKKLWMEDLNKFLEYYDKHLKIYEERHYS